MILQFKNSNGNFAYEEAETITIANVEITVAKEIHANDSEEHARITRDILQKCEDEIIAQTNCSEIDYEISKPIYRCGIVKVAILKDKNKHRSYVFDLAREVYLLNDSGKTIKKI